MHRGASGGRLFAASGDAAGFVAIVGDLCRIRPIEVHAYCVMGNHYHLLVRAALEDLGSALDLLEDRYARGGGGRNAGCPRPFEGRRRVLSVQRSRHLLLVSRYIHRNPVEAGLVAHPEEWPHSSFAAYLNPAHAPAWLKTAAILGAFGSIGARERYRRFVESDDIRRPPKLRAVESGAAALDPGPALASIAKVLAEAFGVRPEEIRVRPGKRTARGALARGAVIHAALELRGDGLRRLAAWLGYRSTASGLRVAFRFREAAAADRELADLLRGAIESLRAKER